MVNSNVDALGILFPNSYDSFVPELVAERSMASIPFAGRYRMVDFLLIQYGKLRDRQYLHYRASELPFSYGSPGSGREWDWCGKTEVSISFLPMRKST